EDDHRDAALDGGVEDGAGDVVAEHEQVLDDDRLFLELVAEQSDGGFAVGLLLLAHLPAAGARDVDDQDLGRHPARDVAYAVGDLLRRVGAADGDEDSAHALPTRNAKSTDD